MAHAVSSSPSSDALVISDSIKFLAITEEDDLLEYTTAGKQTTLVEKIGYDSGCSVALVGNFVYVVGGCENNIPTTQVVFYDITPSSISLPLVKHQGPSLNSPKLSPRLIVMASKLFAFSWQFNRVTPPRKGSYLVPESPPVCEFLDTWSPLNKWCPLTSFPILPSPISKGLFFYSIASFAVQLNNHTLFLSFGGLFGTTGVYSVCYDDSTDLWTNVQPTPLPFVEEAKFVEDLCFGLPCGMDRHGPKYVSRDYISCYKLTVDWEMTKTFTYVTLTTYSLLSNSTLKTSPYSFSFFPVSSRVLTTICAKPHGYSSDYSSAHHYSLDLEVRELLPLKVEKKQLEGMKQIIDLHSTHVLSTTSYSLYHETTPGIVAAYR